MATLTKAEAAAVIHLISGWYEGRTLESEGYTRTDPVYTAAVKLARTAEVPLTDGQMRWAIVEVVPT